MTATTEKGAALSRPLHFAATPSSTVNFQN